MYQFDNSCKESLQDDGSYELNENEPYGPDTWTWIYDYNISSQILVNEMKREGVLV